MIFHGAISGKTFTSGKIATKPGTGLTTNTGLCKRKADDSSLVDGGITIGNNAIGSGNSHIEFQKPFMINLMDTMDLVGGNDYQVYLSFFVFTASKTTSSKVKGDKSGSSPDFKPMKLLAAPAQKRTIIIETGALKNMIAVSLLILGVAAAI